MVVCTSFLNSNHHTYLFAQCTMVPESLSSHFSVEVGQTFYSELAGHLFTARGTDVAGRIDNDYFARETQESAEHPRTGSNVDSRQRI